MLSLESFFFFVTLSCPFSDETFPSVDTLFESLGREQKLSFTDLPITHSECAPAIVTFKSSSAFNHHRQKDREEEEQH